MKCLGLSFLFLIATLSFAQEKSRPEVWVLQNGTLYDGTGNKPIQADLLMEGDRITRIDANIQPPANAKVVNCKNLLIAPGFIDLHTHSDAPIVTEANRDNRNYTLQGVTTIVTGNCGSGPVDVAEFYRKINTTGAGSNVCHLLPHNDVRQKVMGNINRAPTRQELEQMKTLIDIGMKDGAWGMSTGLIYTPGTYAQTPELIALAKVVAEHNGIYTSHIRSEGSELLSALTEAVQIGKEAKLPIHISHLKASGRSMWGKANLALATIEAAQQAGLKVTADQYPYTASSTSLQAIVIPSRFREGTRGDLLKRFDDEELGKNLRTAIADQVRRSNDGKDLKIARFRPKPDWQGKDIYTIAKAEGKTPVEIIEEIERGGGAQMVHFGMNEEDVRLIARQKYVATASDGAAMKPDNSVPHPRSYGTFAKKIGRWAIRDGMLSIEAAIHSATGLPAAILHMKERGLLKEKYFADVVVLDPITYVDQSTYEKPHQYATGVKFLFVNGVPVVADGNVKEVLPGRALKRD